MRLHGWVRGNSFEIQVLSTNTVYCSRRCRSFIPVALAEDSWDKPSMAVCNLFEGTTNFKETELRSHGRNFLRCTKCLNHKWVEIQ